MQGPLVMTETPVIVRDFVEDALPKPSRAEVSPYVLHDPGFRAPTPTNCNLLFTDRSLLRVPPSLEWKDVVEKKPKLLSTFDLSPSSVADKFQKAYPYLCSTQDLVIDTHKLRKDKYYQLYFLLTNPSHVHNKMVPTREEKIAFWLEKLQGSPGVEKKTKRSREHIPKKTVSYGQVYIKKAMPHTKGRAKNIRIAHCSPPFESSLSIKEPTILQPSPSVSSLHSASQTPQSPLSLKSFCSHPDTMDLIALKLPKRKSTGTSPRQSQMLVIDEQAQTASGVKDITKNDKYKMFMCIYMLHKHFSFSLAL